MEVEIAHSRVLSDMDKYIKLNKEFKELSPVVDAYESTEMLLNIDSTKQLLSIEKDEEIAKWLRWSLISWWSSRHGREIRFLLIPKDPEDEKDAILGSGPVREDEYIFAGDLVRMYTNISRKGCRAEINSYTEGTVGGYKEIVMSVTGEGVYGTLKYESVHRVQGYRRRTQGRVLQRPRLSFCLKPANLTWR